jgi:hypothetical protein
VDAGGSDAAHRRPHETASRTEQVPHAPGTIAPFSISVRPSARDSARAAGRGAPSATPQDSAAARTVSRPGADPGLRRVLSRDLPAERVLPAPPPPSLRVPSAPGIAAPVTRLAPSRVAAPLCDCTIRGTVEVQWDRPLTSRTEVVIAVEDAPDVSATAELFMGSPRAFEIHPAPCGVHRLLLWTRSRQRFVLVSQEPRVVCTPGGVQQMRLVLEPVARWGAAQ